MHSGGVIDLNLCSGAPQGFFKFRSCWRQLKALSFALLVRAFIATAKAVFTTDVVCRCLGPTRNVYVANPRDVLPRREGRQEAFRLL